MKYFYVFMFLAVSASLKAQFPIGHISINFNDAARTGGTSISGAASTGSGRAIGTEVYYPAVTAGNNTVVAAGQFPVVVFGHGFVMTYDAYTTLFDSLAQNGFIVAMVTTEGSFSPVHLDFVKDLAKVVDELLLLNTNNINGSTVSPFIGRINGRAAIGGHSMGGGASLLADQFTTNPICYFNFAAAETTPSAVTVAASITKPELLFSGTYDCVAPAATNQTLMYNALTSACKQQIRIFKGYHCEFADASVTCGFGEGTCMTAGGLTSVQQQTIVRMYLEPYLDYYLKGICPAWTKFQNLIVTATTDTITQSCNNSVPANAGISGDTTFCQASSTNLTANPSGFQYLWNDSSTAATLNVAVAGSYSVAIGNGVCQLPAVYAHVSELDTPIVTGGQQLDTLGFQSNLAAASATWYNAQGNVVGAGNFFSPTLAGSYYVVVTDSAGCSGTSAVFNFIAMGNTGLNDNRVFISPNPASAFLRIALTDDWKNGDLKITDASGRVVMSQSISSGSINLELNKFSKGIYWVAVSTGTKTVNKKLVVE